MKTIVIGGGVQGLACAFALGKRRAGSVLLLEAKRMGYGESSRGGGGVRAQFKCEPNIRLATWSMQLLETLSGDLRYHILYHHGGYMYLHYSAKGAAGAEQEVQTHNRMGVHTRLITPQEAARIVPGLNVEGVQVAQYNSHDAAFHHDALLWGYYLALRRFGVEVRNNTKVTALETQNGKVMGVRVGDELLTADHVIVATGAWTRDILETVNVTVPTKPYRRETMVIEGIRHFLEPFVIDKRTGVSFHQTVRGELIGSAYLDKPETPSMNWNATRPTIEKWSRVVSKLFPALSKVAVMRQWSGSRDFTPDGTPLFGPVQGISGLWMVCGQSGVGLMLAPAISEAIAKEMLGQEPGVDWEVYSPRRFETGKELWERAPSG